MTYNVYQHWDPLKVCAVGRCYPPEFFSFIKNSYVRSVMERIAQETEEDFQKLIKLLESFNVKVVRTNIAENSFDGEKFIPPPLVPRDYTAMIGNRFFMPRQDINYNVYDIIKGSDWTQQAPTSRKEWDNLNQFAREELSTRWGISSYDEYNARIPRPTMIDIEAEVKAQGNEILYGYEINTAMTTRVGKDLYTGLGKDTDDPVKIKQQMEQLFPEYRCHVVNTGGHADSVFCPVVPGLIVSLYDIQAYEDTFPGWEVVYLPNSSSWELIDPFLELKTKNRGKWWVPGEELNDEFTDYVNSWLGHWMGYVEETVFDVNMLVINEKNVVCCQHNDQVFEAFKRYNITPHVINFRHRWFWDGGLHCITSDLHREGTLKDYFPERQTT